MLRSRTGDVVFLFDVDNTLLDNDRFSAALDARLTQVLGAEGRKRYRQSYETLRDERGYADYLEPLQRIRQPFVADSALLQLSTFVLDFPFAGLVYPGALDALAATARIGTTLILSDGDMVFQPRKIQRSGLWDAVEGRVLLAVHKQRTLDAVQKAYPARHYVMNAIARRLPSLTGGSADLDPSTKTALKDLGDFNPPLQSGEDTQGSDGGGWSHDWRP